MTYGAISCRGIAQNTGWREVVPTAEGCFLLFCCPGLEAPAWKWTFSAVTDVWVPTGSGRTARPPGTVSRASRICPGLPRVHTRDAENANRAIPGHENETRFWARAWL